MSIAKASTKHADIKEMMFERALKELETIVNRLERGEVLREHCERLLKQAEARVEKLTFAADGTPKSAVPLDPKSDPQ